MPALASRDNNLQNSGGGSPRHSLSNSNNKSPPRLGKVAAIQAANQRRLASNPDLSLARAAGHANSPRRSGNLPAPLVVESQRYEEWMKIATDNKITSTNTWNLALIDYFHDMSLLRNGDGDNSINFQKASCTLDGCVKIWTSRVDSVATETGKLLSGLAEDGRSSAQQDEDDESNDEDDDETREKKAKKRTARQAATLADSFAKLRVKAFDLEFTVDPLFKKTSADFDEGGAGGILMNHLGCDGNMKVVFDAGDAKVAGDEEDGGEVEEEEEEEIGVKVDLSKLRAKCLPPSLASLSSFSLCPSLSSFRFSPDATLDLGILNPVDDDEPPAQYQHRPNAHLANDDEEGGGGEFGGFGQEGFGGGGVNDGFDFGGGGEEYGGGGGEVDFFAEEMAADASLGGGQGLGGVEAFDPRRAPGDRELVMAMDGAGAGGGEQIFDYFDQKLGGKNWAGPEHWKMRRVVAKKDETTTTAKQRKEKITFSFDFTQPPPLSQEELFATAPTAASIRSTRKTSLPSASAKGRRASKAVGKEENYTLPDDHQFNSQILLRLFLKPKTALKMRRRGPPQGQAEGAEIDAQYWAQAGAHGEGDMGGMDPLDQRFGDDDGFGGDDYAVPFDTQMLNADDDDLPYFNEDDEDEPDIANLGSGDGPSTGATEEEPEDMLLATQGQLKRVRPENINYAKRAKRVDVKKLKDSIWKELEDVTIPVKEFPTAPAYHPTPSSPSSSTPSAPESLVPVVSGLRKLYPADKMAEISTSFCFICLLHLANEKGLRIQTPAGVQEGEEDDGLVMRKTVGGLEGLRVYREVGEV
ncbi:condensin complex subunit 2/barren [Leucosporidium creatinivorum]|uniref:Condensin complex subunit 2 n=1 Tax=Leucosporidium creatinivorum TaxID=106004 RepID=A0A1Y2FHQ6_9BASI|nr:condensin complex subunit 2/barren [Leucosporidium creatinivorum]